MDPAGALRLLAAQAPLAALAGAEGVALDAAARAASEQLQLHPVRAYAEALHARLLGCGAQTSWVNAAVLLHGSTLAHAEGGRLSHRVLEDAGLVAEDPLPRPAAAAAASSSSAEAPSSSADGAGGFSFCPYDGLSNDEMMEDLVTRLNVGRGGGMGVGG